MNAIKINNPVIPYWGNIPGNITPGKAIHIRGIFPLSFDKSEYSQINLCEGSKDLIALHISIRFNHHEVVRNSYRMNKWEKEETGGPFPFEQGSEFWIEIIAREDGYHISVNTQPCWIFHHRMPYMGVSSINIDGPLKVYQIEILDLNAVFPSGGYQPPPRYPQPGITPGICQPAGQFPPRGIQPTAPLPQPGITPGTCQPSGPYQPGTYGPTSSFLETVYNPAIPFTQIISGGIQPGMMFYISGIPLPNFKRFTVNFQCGSAQHPPPDIAFHFDVRAFSSVVVRNTRRDNKWLMEEQGAPTFPFKASVPFDMIILVQSDKYMVAVNGQHFIQYNHRMTHLPIINTLRIENDVKITSIRFAR